MKLQNAKIILGLKVKQLRLQKQLSFADLAVKANISSSYLNEIEKGKKYPKQDKIESLARALEVDEKDLTSLELDKNLSSINQLLKSNFLNELPLDLFGIELSKVVELIANAPTRVGAFISTLLEISRNYALNEESFYLGALRSYLEMHDNYFQEIEDSAKKFCQLFNIPQERPVDLSQLESILTEHFGYKIEKNGLDHHPELQELRAIFVPGKKTLLLNSSLNRVQISFQYCKELAFNFLNLEDRALTSSLLKAENFEKVLNHSKATYFSVLYPLTIGRVFK